MKPPTQREKVEQYENFLHLLNIAVTCGNNEMARRLVENADRWSYAHRVGNGQMSERQQKKAVTLAFWGLCKYQDEPEDTKETPEYE